MAYVIGCLMACLSFLVNKVLLKIFGPGIIISYSPLVEESAKTLFPYFFGADIFLTHVTFGLLEAGNDFYYSHNSRWQASLGSLLSHSFFGVVTVGAYKLSESIVMALLAGFIVHWICNVVMVNLYSS